MASGLLIESPTAIRVFLAYWQDLTEAEIADTMDRARSTVHRTLVRARITVRKALR